MRSVLSFSIDQCSLDDVTRCVSVAVDLAVLVLGDDRSEAGGELIVDLDSAGRWRLVSEVCLAASEWLGEDAAALQVRLARAGGDFEGEVELLSDSLSTLAWVANQRTGEETGALTPPDLDPLDDESVDGLLALLEASAAHLRRVAWFSDVVPAGTLRCAGGSGLRAGVAR